MNNIGISATLTERYKELDLIKLEDVRKFVTSCGVDQKLLKALVLSFLSSGQAQAEITSIRGKHLKNVTNGIAIIKMSRGKTNTNYMFFLGSEALAAIKDYKPIIADDEYVFTQEDGKTKLSVPHIDMLFMRHSDKIGFNRGYINPHRFRHYFKTALTGNMDTNFIEYLMGHKLNGVQSSYFMGTSIQERMLDAYTKNQDKLTIFTDQEVLQKQYDELKQKHDTETETIKHDNETLKAGYDELKAQMDMLVPVMNEAMKRLQYLNAQQEHPEDLSQAIVKEAEKYIDGRIKTVNEKVK